MIGHSSGFYMFMATLFGAVGIGMLCGTYWSFETQQIVHVVFSLLMATCGILASWICINRARALRKG